MVGLAHPQADVKGKCPPTVRMWFNKTSDIAKACSVFSLAMIVSVLIWYLSFMDRSDRESLKSPATSAAGPVLVSDDASLCRDRFCGYDAKGSAGRFASILPSGSGLSRI